VRARRGSFPAVEAASERYRYDTPQVLRFCAAALTTLAVLLTLSGLMRLLGGSSIAGVVWTSFVPALASLGVGTFVRQLSGYDPDSYDADLFD
jgi:hypothetical protein